MPGEAERFFLGVALRFSARCVLCREVLVLVLVGDVCIVLDGDVAARGDEMSGGRSTGAASSAACIVLSLSVTQALFFFSFDVWDL